VNTHDAPGQPMVPMQRDAPPLNVQRATPAPATAARDGHHDWGAVVAVLAATVALMALLGPAPSVTNADHTNPPRESTVSAR
jgi:hypothetical protein